MAYHKKSKNIPNESKKFLIDNITVNTPNEKEKYCFPKDYEFVFPVLDGPLFLEEIRRDPQILEDEDKDEQNDLLPIDVLDKFNWTNDIISEKILKEVPPFHVTNKTTNIVELFDPLVDNYTFDVHTKGPTICKTC
jgi:hypothetical protein